MIVYHEDSDSFQDLESAYKNGWLTQDAIALLYARYAGSFGDIENYEALLEPYKDYLETLKSIKGQIDEISE